MIKDKVFWYVVIALVFVILLLLLRWYVGFEVSVILGIALIMSFIAVGKMEK